MKGTGRWDQQDMGIDQGELKRNSWNNGNILKLNRVRGFAQLVNLTKQTSL